MTFGTNEFVFPGFRGGAGSTQVRRWLQIRPGVEPLTFESIQRSMPEHWGCTVPRFLRKFVRVGVLCGLSATNCSTPGQRVRPQDDRLSRIPRVWDDDVLASLEIPLANAAFSPKHVSSSYYERIPVREIYRSYPVYAPGREPPGYIEWLTQQEPSIAFDSRTCKTEADWIRAGEIVFDAPITLERLGSFGRRKDDHLYLRDPSWYDAVKPPVASDGTIPFFRYAIQEKGKIEIGILACGMCHTRVMPDGSVIKAAQGNFPFDRAMAHDYRTLQDVENARLVERVLFTTPWIEFGPGATDCSIDFMASAHEAIPPGVLARHRTTPSLPVQIPDLIGVRDRRYLDRSGLQQHQSIGDLMRYAALNQGGDDLAQFGDFIPMALLFEGVRPAPEMFTRYSDEQLYALALFVYSVEPPPNPNKFDELAARGQAIFAQEGCIRCHTPPLYTNNKLTPASGFTIPDDHREKYAILETCVDTDPQLTLATRRGTGYYKVPSLKGVWYRGPFEHNGSVAALEDWFDPRRLRDDYVPTGWKGPLGTTTRAVRGHPFGLELSDDDKRALIAFLRTL